MASGNGKGMNPPKLGEAIFDIFYLLFVITSGIIILAMS